METRKCGIGAFSKASAKGPIRAGKLFEPRGETTCFKELQSLCFYLNCVFIWDGLRVAIEIS